MEPSPDPPSDTSPSMEVAAPRWVRAVRRLARGAAVLGATVSAAIMVGIVSDVATRQVTGRSIPGMLELVETFMVVVVYVGLAYSESIGMHVKMSLFTRALPPMWRLGVRISGLVVCLLGSAWFAWVTAGRAIDATLAEEVRTGLLRFPVWPARIAVAVGFALLALEYGVRIWEEWSSRPRSSRRRVSATVATDLRQG